MCLNVNFSWGYSAQLQELHIPAALRSSKLSHWFNNEIQKLKKAQQTKKNPSNGGLSVACFKCKPACLERLHRSSASMLKLQDWSVCQRQKASLVCLPKQVKLYLKQVKWSHPGSRRLFLFSLQTESIIENQFSASSGGLRARWRGFIHQFGRTCIFDRAWSHFPFSQVSDCWPPASFKWGNLLPLIPTARLCRDFFL